MDRVICTVLSSAQHACGRWGLRFACVAVQGNFLDRGFEGSLMCIERLQAVDSEKFLLFNCSYDWIAVASSEYSSVITGYYF
jgi:hypothetical protein